MSAPKILIIILILVSQGWDVAAQCELPNAVPIADLGNRYGYIRIENATNDDLSMANQGLCGVKIKFKHESVGDVNLILGSPGGQRLALIKKGGSRSTDGTEWDIEFIPCSGTAVPDQGNFIKPTWDSDQDWGENKRYNGTYYAETCLEDFNRGPVNGIWTLAVSDLTGTGSGMIESFSLEFCNPAGINCAECLRAGGVVNRDTIRVCGGDPMLGAIRIFPTYSGPEPDPIEYDYQFVAISQGRIIDISKLPDLQSAPSGDYLIYGISVHKDDLATLLAFNGGPFSALTNALNAGLLKFCATFSSGYKVYQILSDPGVPNVVERFICPQAPIVFNGNTITSAGVYIDTLTSAAGCDSVVEMRVSDFDIIAPIDGSRTISCNNKPLALSWTNNQFATAPGYSWTTVDGSILSGQKSNTANIDLPGTYRLAISKGGCSDTLTATVSSDGSLPTLLLEDIVMDCAQNIGLLRPVSDGTSFSWSGPFGYTSAVKDIDITEPGLYTLVAQGPNCAVRKTIRVGADFDRPMDIQVKGGAIKCTNDSVQLEASSSTAGVGYTWTGPGGFASSLQNPWVYQPGIYFVSIGKPGRGCVEMRQVEVANVFAVPSINVSEVQLDCKGLSKRIPISINDPLATFAWTGPGGYQSTDKSPVIDEPGKYFVAVSDVNQCLYLDSAMVTVDTLKPSVSATDINLTCTQDFFNLDASISMVRPLNVSWIGPNGFSASAINAQASQAGQYQITVTDPTNSCSATTTILVSADPGQPDLTTGNGFISCEQPSDTLRALTTCTTCTFKWEGPSGYSNSSDTAVVVIPGNYSVTVTDPANGCLSIGSFAVQNRTRPIPRTVSVVPIGCTTDGSVTLSNTNQMRTFEWTDLVRMETHSTPKVTSVSGTNLRLISTDNYGCVQDSTYEIKTFQDDPILSIIAPPLDCARDSTTLSISIANYPLGQVAAYDWTLLGGRKSFIARPREGGTGQVELSVLMRNGCKVSAVGEITTDFSTPELTARGGGFACKDPGLMLEFDIDRPPLTTLWTGPNGFQSYQTNPIATTPGDYVLQVQGANGCLAADSTTVFYTDIIPTLVAFGDTISCLDTVGDLSFDTDAVGYTFSWLDPGGRTNLNEQISTTLGGPYQLQLLDSNGCKVLASAVVGIDTVSIGQKVSSTLVNCINSTTTLELDSVYSSLQYSWVFDSVEISTVAEPDVENGGNYTLVTTNTNGCQRTINHIVEADTVSPVFTLPADTLDCENTRFTIRSSPTNSTWNYSWSGPGGFMETRVGPLIENPGQYTLTATARNGCSHMETTQIAANFDLPEIGIDSTFLRCDNDSAVLSFFTPDSLAETNWFGPSGFYSDQIATATGEQGWYYLLAKGQNGCEAFDSQFVSGDPLLEPMLIDSQGIDCVNRLGHIRIQNVLPGYAYDFLDMDLNVVSGDTMIESPVAATYIVRAIDTFSTCALLDTISILVDTVAPTVSIVEQDSIICEHREITLGSEVDVDVTYDWSTGNGHIVGGNTNPVVNLDQPGTYQLEVRGIGNGCIGLEGIDIVEKFSNLRNIYVTTYPVSCDGTVDGAIVVDSTDGGSGPFSFSLNNEYFTSQNVFQYLEADQYPLFVTDVNGCMYDTMLTVDQIMKQEVDLGPNEVVINLGDSLHLQVTSSAPVADILWFGDATTDCFDCDKLSTRPLQNGYYFVQVTSTEGCAVLDTVFVRVADPGGIYVPNAFTPNGDDLNDYAEVYVGANIDRITLYEVFDRWGNNVFSAFDFPPGAEEGKWNGMYRGSELNPGVFVYQVRAIDIRGNVKTAVGDITILR